MLPAPLWFALTRAMLVVEDGTRITPLSLHGEGKEEAASPQKGSQPRLAALGSPFQGKGLARSFPPSYGRRCPEGAEVGWGSGMKDKWERSSQVRRLRKHPIHRWRGPPSPMGKAAKREYRFSRIVGANTRICGEKQYRRIKPSPRGEGGERSEPDRVLAV